MPAFSYFTSAVLISMSIFVLALPTSSDFTISQIQRRDPCGGSNGAASVINHEYRDDICPPKLTIQPNESCPVSGWDNSCCEFCKVRIILHYDTEAPFLNSYCDGPLSCTVSSTTTITITCNGGTGISLKLTGALIAGISGGSSTGIA